VNLLDWSWRRKSLRRYCLRFFFNSFFLFRVSFHPNNLFFYMLIPEAPVLPRDKLTSRRTEEDTKDATPLVPNFSDIKQSIDPTAEIPTFPSSNNSLSIKPSDPQVAKKVLELESSRQPIPSHGFQQGLTNHTKRKETVTHDPRPEDSSLCMAPPSQPYSPHTSRTSSIFPATPGISTLGHLEKLLRQRPENMAQILFNLDPDGFAGLFGQFGFDVSFLTAFLDAIVSRREEEGWLSQSIALLGSLRKCGRFKIALAFASAEKVRQVFEMMEIGAVTEEQRTKVGELKQFWDLE